MLIDQSSYLLEMVRYIHRNALEAKLESRLGQHRWTSHRAYMRGKESPSWLKRKVVLSQLSRYEGEAKRALDVFVNGVPSREVAEKLRGEKWPVILGGEKFGRIIEERIRGKKIDHREVPEYRQTFLRVKSEAVLAVMERELGLSHERMVRRSKGEIGKWRRAFIYLCRDRLKRPCREIAESLGGVTYAAITNQYQRACREISQKGDCYTHVQKLHRVIDSIKC